MARKLDTTLAVLNGVIGDYLARTRNGLAIRATFVHEGRPLALEREVLASTFPNAGAKLVVLVHGLMSTEDFWRQADGSDYGTQLARDFGFTPLYLRYNTGLAIADNGASLSRLLAELVAAWPVEIDELILLGHSMGGLVIRNACHVGQLDDAAWMTHVRRCIYVGTPHRGAPLERAGRLVAKILDAVDDPYTRLIAELANLRSTGIQDLGDRRHPVPLLPTIDHLLIAGTLIREPWLAPLFGDLLVSVGSATDRARGEPNHPTTEIAVFPGLDHVALARRGEVYERMRQWCEAPTR
ncbi:esterase/lipase family protein [Nannocystaceae bacterium ST9]